MQISRMPIPADNCSNSEMMSVDSANPSDSKSDVETTTKVNGDSNKKLMNGSTVVESSNETDESSDVVVKEENVIPEIKEEPEEPKINAESLSQNTDDLMKNGASKVLQECDGNFEKPNKDETSLSTTTMNDDDKPKDDKEKAEEVKPQTDENQPNEVVVIKKEPGIEVDNPESAVDINIQETEKLQNSVNNGEVSQSDDVINNEEDKLVPVNGGAKVNEDKIIESEKEKAIQKVPEEEDVSSEMSTDALSPKQVLT